MYKKCIEVKSPRPAPHPQQESAGGAPEVESKKLLHGLRGAS